MESAESAIQVTEVVFVRGQEVWEGVHNNERGDKADNWGGMFLVWGEGSWERAGSIKSRDRASVEERGELLCEVQQGTREETVGIGEGLGLVRV